MTGPCTSADCIVPRGAGVGSVHCAGAALVSACGTVWPLSAAADASVPAAATRTANGSRRGYTLPVPVIQNMSKPVSTGQLGLNKQKKKKPNMYISKDNGTKGTKGTPGGHMLTTNQNQSATTQASEGALVSSELRTAACIFAKRPICPDFDPAETRRLRRRVARTHQVSRHYVHRIWKCSHARELIKCMASVAKTTVREANDMWVYLNYSEPACARPNHVGADPFKLDWSNAKRVLASHGAISEM